MDINWTRNHCPVPRSHPWSANWQNPNSLVSPIKIRPRCRRTSSSAPAPSDIERVAPRVTDSVHNNFAFPSLPFVVCYPPYFFLFLFFVFAFPFASLFFFLQKGGGGGSFVRSFGPRFIFVERASAMIARFVL